MRNDTSTYLAVIGEQELKVDPAQYTQSDAEIDAWRRRTGLCRYCVETVFSPLTWAHLRGDTLDNPVPSNENENADYHIDPRFPHPIKMFNGRSCSRNRGPMCNFSISVASVSAGQREGCKLCMLVRTLDGDQSILQDPKGPEDIPILRLQAFWPAMAQGSMQSMLLEVGLHPEWTGNGDVYLMAISEEAGEFHRGFCAADSC